LDSGNGVGAKSRRQTEKCLSLCFFTDNLNETLLISIRAAVDAAIQQDAKLGRLRVAFVPQLIVTLKRQLNGYFHSLTLVFSTPKRKKNSG